MNVEDAIDELKSIREYGEFNLCQTTCNALDMAIEALEHTRWIPVSERLPDKDGDYLCIHYDGGKMCCDVLNYEQFDLMGRVSKKFLDHYYGFDFEATHWMPLPKPQEVE